LSVGLFLRLLLMPYAVHDDFVVLQHPLQQIITGDWNIFSDYLQKYTPYFKTPTYPPLYYLFTSFSRYFANLFSSTLPEWMDHCWKIIKHTDPTLTNVDYFNDLEKYQVFRNLFLLKWHYLLCDLIIGWLLLKLKVEQKVRLWAFALWMLNPFTLHSAFAHGQYDLIPAVFCFCAVYLLQTRHKGPGILFLSIGSLIKIYPAFFILPVLILISRDLKESLKLILWASIPFLLFLLPLAVLTGGLALQFMHHYEINRRLNVGGLIVQAQKVLFFAGIIGACYFAYCKRKDFLKEPLEPLLRIFLIVLLILFLSTAIEFRYYIWLIPFVLTFIIKDRTILWLILLQAVSITVLRIVPQRSIQIGIFSPLLPEFFTIIPSWDLYISQIINSNILYKIAYRLFLLADLVLLVWIWRPYFIKYIKLKYIQRLAMFLTLSLLIISVFLIITGYSSYKKSLVIKGEYVLTASIKEKLQVIEVKNINGRLEAVTCFTARRDGLSSILNPEIMSKSSLLKGPGPYSGVKLENAFLKAELDERAIKASGRELVFDPTDNISGEKVCIDINFAVPEEFDLRDYEFYITAKYTWPHSFTKTLSMILYRITFDRPFFYFHSTLLVMLFFSFLFLPFIMKNRS